MSQGSSYSSRHSTPYSSSMSWSSRPYYCVHINSSNGPYDVHVAHLHQEEHPDSPIELFGTADYPMEVSFDTETDPSEVPDSQGHYIGSISIGSQDYYTHSDSVEDVIERMRPSGTMVANSTELLNDSYNDIWTGEALSVYPSLSAYQTQVPPIPSIPDDSTPELVTQGDKLVYDYFKEFINPLLYEVSAEQDYYEAMAAFFKGLRPALQAAMETRVYQGLSEMVNHAMNVEQSQIRNYTTRLHPGLMENRGCVQKEIRGTEGRKESPRCRGSATPLPGSESGTNGEDGSRGSGENGRDEN